ncbi:hypothetical protein OHT52_21360 [Streptomyces sp. NBC_00247]|uniref:hypothetical protein n=1 Tax=Streptomyces sp. NBC_00247 TaxID=2975689 RepID=UPI002E2CD9CB|nr:hypothetical protein [Streptomyces sp. NBC_00247]
MNDLTAGTRTTTLVAAVITTLGAALMTYGITVGDTARCLGGVGLTMPALTFIALVAVRRWVTDTSRERASLADAQRAADAERMRYVAAQAAQLAEAQRLRRDVAAERAQLAARLDAERAAMQDVFEEQRATLVSETMETTVQMLRDGAFVAEQTEDHGHAKVMQFPLQQAARPRPEATRDRGATRG